MRNVSLDDQMSGVLSEAGAAIVLEPSIERFISALSPLVSAGSAIGVVSALSWRQTSPFSNSITYLPHAVVVICRIGSAPDDSLAGECCVETTAAGAASRSDTLCPGCLGRAAGVTVC